MYIFCKVVVVILVVVNKQTLHTNFAWFWSAFGTCQSKQSKILESSSSFQGC